MRKKLIIIVWCWCSIWLNRSIEAYSNANNSNNSNNSLSGGRTDRETSEVIQVRDDSQFDDEREARSDEYDGEDEDDEELAESEPEDDEDGDDDDDDDARFDPAMYIRKVLSKGDEFTGTLIDSKIVVSSVNAKSKAAKVCDVAEATDCSKVEGIDIDEDIAYLKLTEYNPKPLFANQPSGMCNAVGIAHENIEVDVGGKEILCNECFDFDAVVCGKRLAGILRGDRKFHIVEIRYLRDKAGLTETDKDDDDLDMIADQEKADNEQQYKDTDDDWLSVRKSGQGRTTLVIVLRYFLILLMICLCPVANTDWLALGRRRWHLSLSCEAPGVPTSSSDPQNRATASASGRRGGGRQFRGISKQKGNRTVYLSHRSDTIFARPTRPHLSLIYHFANAFASQPLRIYNLQKRGQSSVHRLSVRDYLASDCSLFVLRDPDLHQHISNVLK
ncbi:hypothetical protein Trydic_g9259 [Trypoxylus dichotomus]